MSILSLWIPNEPARPSDLVLRGMQNAVRVHQGQQAYQWILPGIGVGVLACHPCRHDEQPEAVTEADRHFFWVLGEIFDGGDLLAEKRPLLSKGSGLNRLLFEALMTRNFDGLEGLDGEYILVHWDAERRKLTLANDRFGGLPLYWGQSPDGVAIAGGVRGVLMAPGIEPAPDTEALREAVSFGGFRLGDRTNVRDVRMIPGGSVVRVFEGRVLQSRYWRFRDIPERAERPRDELLDEATALWERAIERRLDGCDRPGQTLSGGLDSRAILAEAAPRAPGWTAVTYGISGCDDSRFAERAARAMDVQWQFYRLYDDPEDWLAARNSHIQSTDGLIALGDLMHVQTIEVQAQLIHTHFSGYIGDVVCGPTYSEIDDSEDLFTQLPYYGTALGLDPPAAQRRILDVIAELDGAPPRYAIFEHKFPQSTNRWTAAWRPWIRVRKPFLDYRLFDFWQGLPVRVRTEQRLYEHLLRRRYPKLFARIPNQKTGVPVLSSRWRHQLTRVGRFAARKVRTGFGLSVPSRAYYDDLGHCSGEQRASIESTILRRDSLCCELLGREVVRDLVHAWFDRGAAPEQVIGALYVYESYHQSLASHLRRARSS